MADQRKTRSRVVGPYEGATPFDVGNKPTPARKAPPPSNTLSPENQRRMQQQLDDQRMDEEMDRASEISRRSSMGTLKPKKYAKGGSVGSASKRADGCAQRGKTKGKMI